MCSKVYLNDIYKYMHILHHVQHSIELLQLNKLCISNFAHYKFVLEEKNEENDQQQSCVQIFLHHSSTHQHLQKLPFQTKTNTQQQLRSSTPKRLCFDNLLEVLLWFFFFLFVFYQYLSSHFSFF